MKLLLDSHALLWFVENDPQMPESIKAMIEDEQNETYVSITSLWELSIKYGLGKLTLSLPATTYLPLALERNRFLALQIEVQHALAVADLPLHHRDLFDRLLVVQSLSEAMPIISADTVLDAYGVTHLW